MNRPTLAAALLLAQTIPGLSTVYIYEGGPYSRIDLPAFGTHMTGTFETDFDSSQFTGTLFLPSLKHLSLTSGDYTTDGMWYSGSVRVVFNEGAIITWSLSGLSTCFHEVYGCYVTSYGPGLAWYTPTDLIFGTCHTCPPQPRAIGPSGSWTAVPVPAPGPSALLLLLLLSRRVRKFLVDTNRALWA